jgi:hypothetical protein
MNTSATAEKYLLGELTSSASVATFVTFWFADCLLRVLTLGGADMLRGRNFSVVPGSTSMKVFAMRKPTGSITESTF